MTLVFENAQWEVTEDYVKAKEGSQAPDGSMTGWYEFSVERLTETTNRERTYYDWPLHMAEKSWVNINLFIEAFGAALQAHKRRYEGDVDIEIFTSSILKAQMDAQNYRE